MDVAAFLTVENVVVMATLCCSLIGIFLYWSTRRPASGFPPGPTPLPFLGNLLDFSSDPPHIAFQEMGRRYGDIFSVKIGQRWTVVLNTLRATREAVIKQPVVFAGRPDLYSFRILSQGDQSIALSTYSEAWAENRKLLHASLRNLITKDHSRFEDFVLGFLPGLGAAIDKQGLEPFDPRGMICQLVYSTLSKVCFGQNYTFDSPELITDMEAGQTFIELVSNGLPCDIFPSLTWVPFRRARDLVDLMTKNTLRIGQAIAGHKRTRTAGETRDLIDMMLDAQESSKKDGGREIPEDFIVTAISDVFGGGTDTTIVTLYWTIALMVEYPEIQKRIACMADEVIGRERLPALADREKLPYIVATVHEILRYSTKLPLSVPHSTTADTMLDGYFIPKDTMVMINIWAIHRSEKHWKDPYSFRPEHFLDEGETVQQHPEGFMPFSTGRRVCMGEAMTKAQFFLLLTWLFQHYQFTKAPGTEDQSYIEHGQVLVANEVPRYKVVATKRF